jgi:hypothetical protein
MKLASNKQTNLSCYYSQVSGSNGLARNPPAPVIKYELCSNIYGSPFASLLLIRNRFLWEWCPKKFQLELIGGCLHFSGH